MSLLFQLSQDVVLGLCNEQLFLSMYRNRWTIYTACTCALRLIVQFSTIAMVVGLVNYTFAGLPLPFPRGVRPEFMAYVLGVLAVILVLHDILSLLLKEQETRETALVQIIQENSPVEETFAQFVSGSTLVETIYPHDTAIKISKSALRIEEEEIATCESLIKVVVKSPDRATIEDWQIIEISSDEEDEIVEITADVGTLLGLEKKALQLRREADAKMAECDRLEKCAMKAFKTGSGEQGRQFLAERDELETQAKECKRQAADHLFYFHNALYSDSKAGLTRLDLHGLYPEEARERILEHLSMCRKRGIKQTRIITGKGLHSRSGKSVLRPMAMTMLELEADVDCMLQPGNSGMIVVDFTREPAAARM